MGDRSSCLIRNDFAVAGVCTCVTVLEVDDLVLSGDEFTDASGNSLVLDDVVRRPLVRIGVADAIESASTSWSPLTDVDWLIPREVVANNLII